MTYDKNTIVFAPLSTNHNFVDLTDLTFARLTVLGYAGYQGQGALWVCECECGTIKEVRGYKLRSGHTQSCGCWRREVTGNYSRTHGESGQTPEYKAYENAKNRCRNPNGPTFHRWGGRGIEFRFASFEAFLKEVGRKPSPKHSLNRIDNDGHYEVGNIEWATNQEQCRNKRNNRILTVNGESRCLTEWAEISNTPDRRIDMRIHRGWCDECAVTQPLRGTCVHKLQ